MRQCSKTAILDGVRSSGQKSLEHKSVPSPCPLAGDAEKDSPRSLRMDSNLCNPQKAGGEPRPSQGCPHPKGTRAGRGTQTWPFAEKEEQQCGYAPIFPKKSEQAMQSLLRRGRSGETRTRGLLVPNQARYKTALHPVRLNSLITISHRTQKSQDTAPQNCVLLQILRSLRRFRLPAPPGSGMLKPDRS